MPEPLVFQKFPIVQKVEPGVYWWCACGRSKSQPFCDGSHKGTGLEPKEVMIEQAQTVAWCACKHSKSMPFCDGSTVGNNDANGANLGGSGIWSATETNWWDSSFGSLQAWTDGNDAIFWGSAGLVTTGTTSPSSVAFKTTGYSLSSGTLTMTGA